MIVAIGDERFSIKDMRGIKSAIGLMFDGSDFDGALISGGSVWMPFCRPLHLYFLDREMRILSHRFAKTLEVLKPSTWRIYSEPEAHYCLELKKPAKNAEPGKKVRIIRS